MNWPFLIGATANMPSPANERPMRVRAGRDNRAAMRLGYVHSEYSDWRSAGLAQGTTASMQTYDVVIIGAGHNGLTCAAYLGMAGLAVKVVERRAVVGGAAVTQEFYPGFRNSVAAYTVSLLNPKIIADLRLFDHGLKIVERRVQNFLPAPDGRYLLTGEGRTQTSIAQLSNADVDNYAGFTAELEHIADVLRELVLQAPPNLTEGL